MSGRETSNELEVGNLVGLPDVVGISNAGDLASIFLELVSNSQKGGCGLHYLYASFQLKILSS